MKITNRGEYAANTQVARYLKRASRGLWGEQRTRLQDELSIHIEGLINSYRMAGTPLDEAVEKALAEMGPPAKVSVEIAQIHTLPLVSMMSLLLVSVMAVITMLAPSVAQSLTSLDTFPTEECFEDTDTPWYCSPEDWVSTDELTSLLEGQGITVDKIGDSLFVKVPGYSKALLHTGPLTYSFGLAGDVTRVAITENGYVQIRSLLEALARANVPVNLGGWETLNFSVADKPFELNFNGSYKAKDFFTNTISQTVAELAPLPLPYYTLDSDDILAKSQTLNIDAGEGEVYGVAVVLNDIALAEIAPEFSEEGTATFYYDIARVGADGQLTLELPEIEGIEFVSSIEALVDNGKALLVKLTGDVGSDLHTIVPAPAM